MRYAIYVRVSTDQQAEQGGGLDVQEKACRAWLRQGGHQLVEVCTDAGRSGTAELAQRPGLVRALALVQDHLADGVLVYRLDRLARDVVLQEQLLAELHRRGNELHSCSATEDEHLVHDPGDPTRALVRRILGAIADYEREMIRLRMRSGMARKAAAGGWVGGGVPYGYAASGRELVPVAEERAAVALMVQLHQQRRSYRAICAALEAREMRPRDSATGRWGPSAVRKIVLREIAGAPVHAHARSRPAPRRALQRASA